MKKYSLSILLVILVLLTLISSAYAEPADTEVSATAAGNSIDFVSIDEVAWDHITYKVRITTTDELARDGYRIGISYSLDPSFSSGVLQSKDTFGTGETPDHYFHEDDWTYTVTRYVVELLPDKTYYIRPMLLSKDVQSFDPIATGSTWNVAGPVGNGDYTNMTLNQPVVPPGPDKGLMIHAKFKAVEGGKYALVGNEDMEFISYGFPDGNKGASRYSVYDDHGDGTTSRTVLKLFFDLSAGDTVYLFGKRAEPECCSYAEIAK